MRNLSSAIVTLSVVVAAVGMVGCNAESNTGHGCGQVGSSPLCGKVCTTSADCGSGTYCGADNTCTADCIAGDNSCATGEQCDPNGQCAMVASNFDGGTGNPFDRDGACAVLSSQATLEKSPVDVILVVDNSGSMEDEIVAIQNNINVNFAQIIGMSGLDYRVILLSKHGTAAGSESICIGAPLSGHPGCATPGTAPVNSANFFHYDTEIGSHDAWERIINTYNVAAPHGTGPMGWSGWLRPNAHKTFILVTDDDPTVMFSTATAFETALFALQPALFGTATDRKYTFHSIIGMKERAAPMSTTAWNPTDPIVNEECTPTSDSESPAPEYQKLSIATGGLRYPICQHANYDAVFKAVAQGVIASGQVACDFPVPTPPNGGTIDLNQIAIAYTPGGGGATKYYKQATSSAACQPDAFYVENGRIFLCPDTCTAAKADPMAKVEVLFVCESTIL